MDFHRSFEEMDEDGSGSISKEELQHYMEKMNYKEGFVHKWLNLFDLNNDGEITYDEFCEVLGLVPKKQVVDRARRVSLQKQTNATLMAANTAVQSSGSPKKSKKKKCTEEEKQEIVEPSISEEEVTQALNSRRRQSIILTNAAKLTASSFETTTAISKETEGTTRRKSLVETLPTVQKSQLFIEQYVKCRNMDIAHGITKLSKNKMVGKKALYRYSKTAGFDKKLKRLQKSVAGIESNEKKEEIKMKTKTIGGDKNGETRQVLESKDPRFFPAESPPKRKHLRRNPVFSEHKRRLKSGLVPGAVLILLSGIHRGKRVVFLKQLKSGLLLVTGPYKLNGCPLRRINQIYTIATSTRIDVNGINIPKRLTDVYFKRAPKKDRKKNSTDIFTENKVDYKASDERKEDQRLVDNQIIAQIKKNKDDKKLLFQYLASMFSLSKKDYPHKMKF